MQLTDYFSLDTDRLHFSREQSSAFAKRIAGDFNPIHDIDAKRFCVPGDLLFAVFLHRYGVRQSMEFEFAGMVSDSTELLLPNSIDDEFSLDDTQGKNYLNVKRSGSSTTLSWQVARHPHCGSLSVISELIPGLNRCV